MFGKWWNISDPKEAWHGTGTAKNKLKSKLRPCEDEGDEGPYEVGRLTV